MAHAFASPTHTMDIPQKLASRRPFYGWYIVGVALVSQFLAIAFLSYLNSVFLKPMTQELGWSRGNYTSVITLYQLLLGFSTFFIGGLVDRRGARLFMVVGGTLVALSTIGLAWVHSLWQFYLLRGVLFALGLVGISNVVANVAVSNWFIRLRGRALGVAALGTSLAGIVLVPLASLLVDAVGWRTAWVVLGIVAWVLIVPAAAILMRRRPEDMGLLPDGARPASTAAPRDESAAVRVPQEEHWTWREASRTPALWLVTLAFALVWLVTVSFVVHIIPLVTDWGFSSTQAALTLSLYGVGATTVKIPVGYLMDRFGPRYPPLGFFLAGGAAVALIVPAAATENYALVLLAASVVGLASGLTVLAQEMFWATYYGRLHLGAIRSLSLPFTLMLGSFGPMVTGYVYDVTGTYRPIFFTLGLLMALASLLMLLARPPRRDRRDAPPQAA